ncbi:MAG: hypothetical protein Q8Q29_05730 [Actinomycetota bacterium]|nr:hypothetical protein [Actinomycetota bacterium]
MRSREEFDQVQRLVEQGLNDCQISRATGIARTTVRDWRLKGREDWWPGKGFEDHWRRGARYYDDSRCPVCSRRSLDSREYAYLLAMYLGDGQLSPTPRGVYKLRIFLDQRYIAIIAECIRSVVVVHGRDSIGFIEREECVELYSYWKHWSCLFPQHGPGRKHERRIRLTEWQREIVSAHPDRFLRGLVHSDGWRGVNRVNGTDYPRYQFKNESFDIRGLFTWACDLSGVGWRSSGNTISVARFEDVLKLDLVVGPKA